MANEKLAITPLIEQLDLAIADLLEPPFRIWEPFKIIEKIGEVLKVADPLATAEEYQDALMEAWHYADAKYLIVKRLDDCVDFREIFKRILGKVFGLLPGELVEAYDARMFRGLIESVAIPQMAVFLAETVK